MKNNQLAIKSSLIPKPTKSETIEAMARIRLSQINDEREEAKKKLEGIEKGIGKRLRKLANAVSTSTFNYYFHERNGKNDLTTCSVTIDIPLNFVPDEVKEMMLECDALKKKARLYPTLDSVKADIRKRVNGLPQTSADRVTAILNDHESCEVLKNLLKAIE